MIPCFGDIPPEPPEVDEYWEDAVFAKIRDLGRQLWQWKRWRNQETERVQELLKENVNLRAALVECVEWLDNAPLDYSNGVTHNGIDEGNVRGWQAHSEIVKAGKIALGGENWRGGHE